MVIINKVLLNQEIEFNICVINLTDELYEKFKKIGFDKICFYYAILKGKKENNNIIPDLNSLDKTNLNFFGAKYYLN